MIVVTGGGTGGHIYPALEVARHAIAQGESVVYLGSLRGHESQICGQEGIEFYGFPTFPIYSLRTLRGLKSLAAGFRASISAIKRLKSIHPSVVFSTGGYSAAPIMAAARRLNTPLVIHEANSIPGRSNRLFANYASSFTSVFHKTKEVLPKAIRAGQPIRELLRTASERADQKTNPKTILVVGGSQGSQFLNEIAPRASQLVKSECTWLHATGPSHFEQIRSEIPDSNYQVVKFFDEKGMADAYSKASVVLARSGGTLAELAMFRLPSVLVPLPTSADNHQFFNAQEFENRGMATIVEQKNASAEVVANAVESWLMTPEKYEHARAHLADWDMQNATQFIWDQIRKFAK